MNLVAFREQRGLGSNDHAALPILFLYRHSFELYIKAIVFRAALLSVNEEELALAIPRLWREHSLVALASMAEPILDGTSRLLVASGDLKKKIFDLAAKIDEFDAGSYSFRYPVTSRGHGSLPSAFFTNIFVFSAHIEEVLDDVAQFCRSLEEECIQSSPQIKLALHSITRRVP